MAKRGLRLATNARLTPLQEVLCPSCGRSYNTDLGMLDQDRGQRAVFTCWGCGHRWGVRRPARWPEGEKGDRT
jgi:DNA-directed RNA polymerase subunit M/transcription elongation factor TFIIS